MYDFSTTIDRKNSLSVKWNREAIRSICNNPDAQPFWVADMDFPAPPSVLSALQGQVTHGVLGYPAFSTTQTVFASWAQKRHNWEVDPKDVVPTPGMLASIATLVELLSEVGDKIILPMPAYQPFVHIITGLGRIIVEWPLHYESNTHAFSLDMPLFEQLSSHKDTPLLLFCSPHNPTGRVFFETELMAIAQIAALNNIAVISDEIHADLTLPGYRHIPFDTVARTYGITCATCMAPSKTFNIAGEHFSIIVSSHGELRNRLKQRLQALHISPDILATVTALSAYQGGFDWLNELRSHLASQIEQISSLLNSSSSGLSLVTPEASFIAFIDCSSIYDAVLEDAAAHPALYEKRTSPQGGLLSRFFGQRAGIAMNDGSWFGTGYKYFVRFNYGTQTSAVSQAISAMIQAVEGLPYSK